MSPESFGNPDSDLKKLLSQIHSQIAQYYSEKLVFLVQNFNSNSEAIPEVVGFKAFEFPALSDVIKEWPQINDLVKPIDSTQTYKTATKYFKQVVLHYQTLSQLPKLTTEDRSYWQSQQVKILVELSRLQKIM